MIIECENLSVFVHYLPCSQSPPSFHAMEQFWKQRNSDVNMCAVICLMCCLLSGTQMYSGGPCCFAAVPTVLKELVRSSTSLWLWFCLASSTSSGAFSLQYLGALSTLGLKKFSFLKFLVANTCNFMIFHDFSSPKSSKFPSVELPQGL